jgi:hypothetical protein
MANQRMTSKEFQRLRTSARWSTLHESGTQVAARTFRGFEVRLFAVEDFYAEVWCRIGLGMVEWVEVIPLQRVADICGADLREISDL